MTDLEAIHSRSARRSYTGKLTATQEHALDDRIAFANLESGLFIRLLPEGGEAFAGVKGGYGLFTGVHGLMLLVGPSDDPDLHEKIGYWGEHLVLEAVKMGLGTCWVSGTFDRAHMAKSLPGSHQLVAVITVGPVKENRSLLGKAVDRVVSGKKLEASAMYTAEGTPPPWFVRGVEAAALAPSSNNRQPVRFAWQGAVATATVPVGDETAMVELGIAKRHFEIAAGGSFALGNGAAFAPKMD